MLCSTYLCIQVVKCTIQWYLRQWCATKQNYWLICSVVKWHLCLLTYTTVTFALFWFVTMTLLSLPYILLLIFAKGQIISECLFDFLNFPKKHRKIWQRAWSKWGQVSRLRCLFGFPKGRITNKTNFPIGIARLWTSRGRFFQKLGFSPLFCWK